MGVRRRLALVSNKGAYFDETAVPRLIFAITLRASRVECVQETHRPLTFQQRTIIRLDFWLLSLVHTSAFIGVYISIFGFREIDSTFRYLVMSLAHASFTAIIVSKMPRRIGLPVLPSARI